MPTYDYRCDANGRTVEVTHAMRETLTTWGDLAERAGIDPGDTPTDAPVERVISLANVSTGSASAPLPGAAPSHPPCGMPGCCRVP